MTITRMMMDEFAQEISSGHWAFGELYRFGDSRIDQYGRIFEDMGYVRLGQGGLEEPWEEAFGTLGGKERELFCNNADRAFRCMGKFWLTCGGWDGVTMRRPGNWADIHVWAKNVEHIGTRRGEMDTHVYAGEFLAGYIHFLNMFMRASDSYIRSCIDPELGRVRLPKLWEKVYRYIALPKLYEAELTGAR